MYRGFNLNFGTTHSSDFLNVSDMDIESYKQKMKEERRKIEGVVFQKIENYTNPEGTIEADKIMDEWFPKENYDIFLSHSHADEKLAIKIAIWLKRKFNLSCFIDSLVWGYSDDLLREIDNKYCYNEKNKTYYYENRNITTSHVRTMLSVSLMQMIDSSECLFFLNTPNSINSLDNQIQNQRLIGYNFDSTRSPWIFNELITASIIRKRLPDRYEKLKKSELRHSSGQFSALQESVVPDFKYQLEGLADLIQIDRNALKEWHDSDFTKFNNPLDTLYKIKGVYHGQ